MSQEISLLNSSIGPVMRGPSSSHSAAPYMIGRTVRELSLGPSEKLESVAICFDPQGSFSQVYSNQGSDEGFAAGVSGIELTSAEYPQILSSLKSGGDFDFSIAIEGLARNEHPNRVDLSLGVQEASGGSRVDRYEAVSTGGGMFTISRLNRSEVRITGKCAAILVEHEGIDVSSVISVLEHYNQKVIGSSESGALIQVDLAALVSDEAVSGILGLAKVKRVRRTGARQYAALSDEVLFTDMKKIMHDLSEGESLAGLALRYESRRLQVPQPQVRTLFQHRLAAMMDSVTQGFSAEKEGKTMRFLHPSAKGFRDAKLPDEMQRGFMKDAIAGALAVMEEGTCRGVVCAAPTAGSAGIVPGCLYALQQAGAKSRQLVDALQVMALVGAVFAARGSYAAETGGCSVETGTSAAMAAGGIVHYYGGSAAQVFDAASLCLMNTLGLVCDPVGGEVEIPCHARNIAGVSHAWSATMAVLGGFKAVLPFDELVDMTVQIGNQMDADLRCTARGGCANTPTAKKLVTNLIHSA